MIDFVFRHKLHTRKDSYSVFCEWLVDKLLSKEKKKKEEPSSLFQRQRVDELLAELSKKFPPRYPTTTAQTTQSEKPG